MNKPTVRLYPTEIAALQWERPEGAAEGVWQKLLSFDPDTGSHTRLLRVEPGVNVPGPFKHDHWEEAYVLQGSYQMADECHPAGTYICRAPNVVHGPFFTEEGYLSLQVRDYAPHTSFPSQ